eukprot:3772767-Prymnesium_polylepis.1
MPTSRGTRYLENGSELCEFTERHSRTVACGRCGARATVAFARTSHNSKAVSRSRDISSPNV